MRNTPLLFHCVGRRMFVCVCVCVCSTILSTRDLVNIFQKLLFCCFHNFIIFYHILSFCKEFFIAVTLIISFRNIIVIKKVELIYSTFFAITFYLDIQSLIYVDLSLSQEKLHILMHTLLLLTQYPPQ